MTQMLDRSKLGPLAFSDEFDRPLAWWSDERFPPAGKRWRTGYEHSRWPGVDSMKSRFLPTERQVYIDPTFRGLGINPFSLAPDGLAITATPLTPDQSAKLDGQTYSSGLISSAQTFQQVYGYWEASIRVPGQPGFFPAFWLYTFDGVTEIDIMEMLTGAPGVLYNGAIQRDKAGVQHGQNRVPFAEANPFPDLSKAFHRFGCMWTPDAVSFYLDDALLWSIPNPPPGVPDTPGWHEPMFCMINLAVSGQWSDGKGYVPQGPATMGVRSVRAYRLA